MDLEPRSMESKSKKVQLLNNITLISKGIQKFDQVKKDVDNDLFQFDDVEKSQ